MCVYVCEWERRQRKSFFFIILGTFRPHFMGVGVEPAQQEDENFEPAKSFKYNIWKPNWNHIFSLIFVYLIFVCFRPESGWFQDEEEVLGKR
jgi:hypothetical protein